MTPSTAPDVFLVHHFVIDHVAYVILPVSNSYTLPRFGLLRTNACVLVLPHATVSVERVFRTSINCAARDFFPAVLCADEVPCGCVIDATAYQDIVRGVTEVAGLAIS